MNLVTGSFVINEENIAGKVCSNRAAQHDAPDRHRRRKHEREAGAAILYSIISFLVIAFQIALAAGASWGAYAMGGAFPGPFPPALRIAAIIQAAVLAGMAAIVLARAGFALPAWSRASRWLIWLVVAFAAISFILNLITPSAGKRAIWAPVAFLLLISSTIVAFSSSSGSSMRHQHPQ